MHTSRWAALAVLFLAGCQTYTPEPVDLSAHAKLFAERMPDAESIRALWSTARSQPAANRAFDVTDGIDLDEGRCVALLFNPRLRAARLRAGIAKAVVDEAGRWQDPQLNASLTRILESSVQYPWLASGGVSLTVPLTGRLGLEKELATGEHAQAIAEARIAEAEILTQIDATWMRWSAALLSASLQRDLAQRLAELEAIASRLAQTQTITQIEARTFTLARVARQADVLRAQNTVAALELELKQLLGLPPERGLALVPATSVPLRIADAPSRRTSLVEGPRVLLAQREHTVAERALALAVRKQWPDLTLIPGWEEEDAQPRVGLGISLPLPLWNANAQEIAKARATRSFAAENLRGALEDAFQRLAQAETHLRSAAEQRELISKELLPLAERQITDARQLAQLGRLDTLLLLDALTRSYDAQLAAVSATLAEADAAIETNSLFWPSLATPGGDE